MIKLFCSIFSRDIARDDPEFCILFIWIFLIIRRFHNHMGTVHKNPSSSLPAVFSEEYTMVITGSGRGTVSVQRKYYNKKNSCIVDKYRNLNTKDEKNILIKS